MPKSPYMRGLMLLAAYLCFEVAFGFLIQGRGRDDAIIARLIVVGGMLFGLMIYSQFARYVGLFLILVSSSYAAYGIVTGFMASGLSSIKTGSSLLTVVIVGQTLFGIAAALYLLSPNFGREFVKLRDDPSQREINIPPSIYRTAISIALLVMVIATYRDIGRFIERLSATETQRSQ